MCLRSLAINKSVMVLLLVAGAARYETESPGGVDGDTVINPSNEAICGPRCVSYILSSLGRRIELSHVVLQLEKMSGGKRGVSIVDLKDYLSENEVESQLIKVPQGHWISSDKYIAIAHLTGSSDKSGGHFVVVRPHPKNLGRVILWDGLLGEKDVACAEIAERTSGAALVIGAADSAAGFKTGRFIKRAIDGRVLSVLAFAAVIALIGPRRMYGWFVTFLKEWKVKASMVMVTVLAVCWAQMSLSPYVSDVKMAIELPYADAVKVLGGDGPCYVETRYPCTVSPDTLCMDTPCVLSSGFVYRCPEQALSSTSQGYYYTSASTTAGSFVLTPDTKQCVKLVFCNVGQICSFNAEKQGFRCSATVDETYATPKPYDRVSVPGCPLES